MFSIAYVSRALAPEFFQLCPDIVNSALRGRIHERNAFCCRRL